MKIGIIAANNIRLSPYVIYYTNILENLNIEYEVIVPDRNKHLIDKYEFNVKIIPWDDKRPIIFNYLLFSKNVGKYVIERFDFLIVLTTISAVFCAPWLRIFFKKKYIVDIRDYTHENNFIYYKIEKRVLIDARACVISSAKFKSFLPSREYWICHNINTPENPSKFNFVKNKDKVIIGYIGAIAYPEQCKKIMKLISEDERFEFHIYGSGIAENIIYDFADTLSCNRIKLFGAYKQIDKGMIIRKVDVLFNVYGNGSPLLECALSNKLYDALYYRKPLLTSKKTYMAEIASDISFEMDLDNKECLNELWGWYQNLDTNRVNSFSRQKYVEFILENNKTKDRIKKLLNQLI